MTSTPIVNLASDRRESILNDSPAIFEIRDDVVFADASYASSYRIDSFGTYAVEANKLLIEQEASAWFTDGDASSALAEWFAANLGDVVDGNLDAGDAFIDLAANDNWSAVDMRSEVA